MPPIAPPIVPPHPQPVFYTGEDFKLSPKKFRCDKNLYYRYAIILDVQVMRTSCWVYVVSYCHLNQLPISVPVQKYADFPPVQSIAPGDLGLGLLGPVHAFAQASVIGFKDPLFRAIVDPQVPEEAFHALRAAAAAFGYHATKSVLRARSDDVPSWSWLSVNLLSHRVGSYAGDRLSDDALDALHARNAALRDREWVSRNIFSYFFWYLFVYSPERPQLEPTYNILMLENAFSAVVSDVRGSANCRAVQGRTFLLGNQTYCLQAALSPHHGYQAAVQANHLVVSSTPAYRTTTPDLYLNPCFPPGYGQWVQLAPTTLKSKLSKPVYHQGSLDGKDCADSLQAHFKEDHRGAWPRFTSFANDVVLTGLANFIASGVTPLNKFISHKSVKQDTLHNVCQPYSPDNAKNHRLLYQDPFHCLQMNYLWRAMQSYAVHAAAILNTINDVLPHWSIGCALDAFH
jgi:hypothetical protein